MTKVYVVTEGNYSDYGIVAIFSSMELAQMFVSNSESQSGYGYRRINDYIEQYELDAFESEIRQGRSFWQVQMGRDGDVDDVRSWIPGDDDKLVIWNNRAGAWFYVWARDKEHAIKIANEKRIQLIASGEWEVPEWT